MPRNQDKRILRVTGEPGEWFVDLRAGFACADANTNGAQHGFGEDTKGAIRRTMKTVRPCACDECRRLVNAGLDE